ncbi:hypothetical protein ACTXT7_015525 [Hymenolepis weldensis]
MDAGRGLMEKPACRDIQNIRRLWSLPLTLCALYASCINPHLKRIRAKTVKCEAVNCMLIFMKKIHYQQDYCFPSLTTNMDI